MPQTIQDKDLGYSEIVRTLKKINGSHVKIGLQGQTGQKTYDSKFDKVTVVDLGIIHEFGASVPKRNIKIPERSFMRSTFDKMLEPWREMNRTLFWKIFTNSYSSSFAKGLDKALDIMGQAIQRDIKNTITKGIPPPNADSTLRAKLKKGRWNKKSLGIPKPLIDTGQMLNSITYEKVIK